MKIYKCYLTDEETPEDAEEVIAGAAYTAAREFCRRDYDMCDGAHRTMDNGLATFGITVICPDGKVKQYTGIHEICIEHHVNEIKQEEQ